MPYGRRRQYRIVRLLLAGAMLVSFLVAMAVLGSGCHSPSKEVAREIVAARSHVEATIPLLETSEAAATAILGAAQASIETGDLLEPEPIRDAAQSIVDSQAAARGHLLPVLDSADAIVRQLPALQDRESAWSRNFRYVMYTTGFAVSAIALIKFGPLITVFVSWIGLLRPPAVRREAKQHVESIETGEASSIERELVNGKRSASPVFNHEYIRQQRAFRARRKS